MRRQERKMRKVTTTGLTLTLALSLGLALALALALGLALALALALSDFCMPRLSTKPVRQLLSRQEALVHSWGQGERSPK